MSCRGKIRSGFWACLGLALVFLVPGCGGQNPPPLQDQKYLVGVFYYQWFPHNFSRGFLRQKLSPPQPPYLGLYSSRDPKVVEQHIRWCSRYGIDFLAPYPAWVLYWDSYML